MSYSNFKAKTLRLADSNSSNIPEISLSPGITSVYNVNRITITPTTISSDTTLILSNINFSGTTTGITMAFTDNSSKLATTAFVKSQTPTVTGYAQLASTQTWSAIQNFSTITATTTLSSDNSSTVATTAFVKANSGGLTLPIVLGTTGVLTTFGQSITYVASNQTFNSTTRCFAPSGFLVPGTYIVSFQTYVNPVTYSISVLSLAASASQMTNGQTSGFNMSTYGYDSNDNTLYTELNNKTVTNGVLNVVTCGILNIVSAYPYVAVAVYIIGGSTTAGYMDLKLTRLA
jgi:hypothetical protein